MQTNPPIEEEEILALKENLGVVAKTKEIDLKEYKASFNLPKENNHNTIGEQGRENSNEKEKKKVHSCNNVHNASSNVKEINVRKVQSNFSNVRKISIEDKGNDNAKGKESKNNTSKNEGVDKEDNKPKDVQEESKINHVQLMDIMHNKNNNDVEDDQIKSETKQGESPSKKKLKIQRTKAPPKLMKKQFIFCCIPVTKKK